MKTETVYMEVTDDGDGGYFYIAYIDNGEPFVIGSGRESTIPQAMLRLQGLTERTL